MDKPNTGPLPRGHQEKRIMPGLVMASMKYEYREAMEHALKQWQEHLAKRDKPPQDEVYSFAYWLYRWSDLVVPAAMADAALTAERSAREGAEQERDRLWAWVHDLQSGMYINCVYCGHRFGPKEQISATMADALKDHIEQCPKHPMSALRQRLAEAQAGATMLRAALKLLRYSDGHFRGECSQHICHPDCVAATTALSTTAGADLLAAVRDVLNTGDSVAECSECPLHQERWTRSAQRLRALVGGGQG